MKKRQPCGVESSSPAMIAIEGKLYKRSSLSPKQITEIDKNISKYRKRHEKALDCANEVFKPVSKVRRLLKVALLGVVLAPGSTLAIGACTAHVMGKDMKIVNPLKEDLSPERADREWMNDPVEAKKSLFIYFVAHKHILIPSDARPLDLGGEIYEATLTYRGVDFRVEFWFIAKASKGGKNGISMHVIFSEDCFKEQIDVFSPDKKKTKPLGKDNLQL